MKFYELFLEVNELDFQDFERFSIFEVRKVNDKQAISKLSDDKSVGVSLIGKSEMSISDEYWSSRPVIGSLKVVAVNKLKLIKDFPVIRIMVHGIDDESSLSTERERLFIDIDEHEQVSHRVKTGDMFS